MKFFREEGLIDEKEFNENEVQKLYDEWKTSDKNLVDFCNDKGIWRYGFAEKCKKLNLYIPVNGKKFLDNKVFDSPLNEESAYWVGLLLADGHMWKDNTGIELGLKDKEHIEKFRTFLKSEHVIEEKTTNQNSELYRITIQDEYLCKRLSELGIKNRKTYNLEISEELENPEIARHFIRGFIDGDGTLQKSYIGITSFSVENLKLIENYINKYYQEPHKFYYQLSENHAPDLRLYANRKQFSEWLYTESTIYLDRKYKKYLDYYAVDEE